MISKVDPYMSAYIYEKASNPDSKIYLRQYEKGIIEDVDKIVEISHGHRGFVKGNKDWDIVIELFNFWSKRWPNETSDFVDQIERIRETRRDGGYSDSGETRYVGALPPRFMKMIKAIFEEQQFDKKFMDKLVKKMPIFKVGGESNFGGGGVLIGNSR
jgi:hypothetical protein